MKNYLHRLYMVTKYFIYGVIIQCFLFTALFASEGNAQIKSIQNVKVDLHLEKVSVKDALLKLEEETGFHFVYNEKELDVNKKVSLQASSESLIKVLEDLSKEADLSFKQINKNISVKPIKRSQRNDPAVHMVLQERTITGRVTSSENSDAIPGVNILVKGTARGTVTDIDGNYSVDVSGDDAVLVFSSIGFVTEEVMVGNQSVINLSLVPDVTSLDEIVVIGYGSQKKADLTGSVSLVDPEEMTKQATNDVTQMMQGRVAGVSIRSDGQPGAAPSVRVRGVSTFGLGAGAEPLYVVDGFPLSGGIRDINPNDIESIQVLKDATAGAIYGNRAANGVVIITTKQGKKGGGFNVGFNAYYGIQTVPQRIPVLERENYQMISNEALQNAGLPLLPGNDPDNAEFYIDDINTDWQDAGYKDGSIQNYNLNVSGGTDNTSYYLSMDYLDNKGTLVGTGPDYTRYSFRVNSETQIGKVKLGENLYVTRSDENPLFNTTTISLPGNRPSLVNDLLQAAPTIPLYDESREGGFGGAESDIHQSITLNVPGINTLIENSTLVDRVLASIYGELEIIEGLTYKLNFQFDKAAITDELFVPEYDLGYFFPGPTAQYQVGNRSSSSYLIENTLNYKKTFGKHDLNVLVGQTYQEFDFREIITFGSGLDKPYIKSLGSAANISATDNQQPSSIASLLGRLNYSYDDRYLLTVNVRRDGSSRFSENNRYEIFPSLGLAWKVHNDFVLPDLITDLKIRGGIGQVGNQEIGNFRFQSTINRAIPYQFGPDIVNDRVLGAATTILVDPSLKWETRTTKSIGLDLAMWDGSFEFTAEYYSNTSDDVLLDLPIPNINGSLAGITTNAGSIKNSGIEFSANLRRKMGDFTLELSPNFYTVNNEVLDLGPLENIQNGGARTVVGGSIGEHYGWVYEGIFQSAEEINTVAPSDAGYDPDAHAFQAPQTSPGDVKFKDLNNDGVITDADRTFLGNGLPTYFYGLNIVANYKNFDLTIFGSGSGGNLINSNIYRGLMGSDAFGFTNRHEDILDRWTPSNTDTDIPRMIYQDANINGRDSDRPGWLQDGDYFRINTISLGYSLPDGILNTLKLTSARIYVTMQNVHTFTKYKGYNPDFQAGTPIPGTSNFTNGILNPGYDYGTFPRPRTTMLGVQLKF